MMEALDIINKPFQFLIGKVKTDPKGNTGYLFFMFQFLIGKVKTERLYERNGKLADVSIPHR